jgi:CRISPR/Cas system-associated exonuclease Cas4 (RecB family)
MISKKENTINPVELKSRESQIYQSDELQLTAYAMILEERYNESSYKQQNIPRVRL